MRTPTICALAACAALAPLGTAAGTPSATDPRDWRWVQGAVFVPTNAVNEAQQWDEYDPAVNERELRYASVYGINVVRVYLHYGVYLKKREALLAEIEDFLARAHAHGIRTEFVFFDDCWNEPPADLGSAAYRYPAPLRGVHNSQWLVSPGEDARAHFEAHQGRLKAYVQDIVRAHVSDPRVAFWEIYNEPKNEEATRRLERAARDWIRETGTPIPSTATGGEFSGGPFSDFPSWHVYGSYNVGGDLHSLCTECMNRKGQTVPGIVEHFRGKVGYIFWELGIGRDNCRFAWDDKRGHERADEPGTPFHGIVYPDGHPWSLDDARALLGAEGFARTPFFLVRYYRDPAFSQLAKTSVTPSIDFDLGDEPGTGSPDASAGVPREHYSIEYTGRFRAASGRAFAIRADSDGRLQVWVDGRSVLTKASPGRSTAEGTVALEPGTTHDVKIRYVHGTGPTSLHLTGSAPGTPAGLLEPATHPEAL